MAYCLEADVEGLTQADYTSTTNPSTSEVSGFIDARSAEIDAVLSTLGYTVPVTATTSLAILKEICKKGVAADALRLRNPT